MEHQDVYHHYDDPKTTISVKVERNSKGYNLEASISNATSVEQAIELAERTMKQLEGLYPKE